MLPRDPSSQGYGSAVIPRSGGVDAEDKGIKPIILDRNRRHIDQIVATAMRTVSQHEDEEASLLPIRAA